jgi:hypothetical protein
MSYGPSVAEMLNISATYVVKILKGAKPGDLPVEQPIARAASVQLFSVGTNATCSDLHPDRDQRLAGAPEHIDEVVDHARRSSRRTSPLWLGTRPAHRRRAGA